MKIHIREVFQLIDPQSLPFGQYEGVLTGNRAFFTISGLEYAFFTCNHWVSTPRQVILTINSDGMLLTYAETKQIHPWH